mmetsp:Transcript_78240/g.253986  ORF Transcript_78240/g.253986 Transcript_78240/m.253986 type:complete len:213 (+) Transcript_78240:753-1391(+)
MLLVLHAYSNNVCSVSTSWASTSVVSRRRSSMFMSTVPFRVTICFRLKVLSLSFGLSKALFKSAKGSLMECSGDFTGLPPGNNLLEEEDRLGGHTSGSAPVGRCGKPEPQPGAASSAPPRPASGDSEASAPAPVYEGANCSMWLKSAKFAVTGLCTPSFPGSTPKSMMVESAASILRSVILSMTWKEISSGLVLATWGWLVSCKKRHKARMT